MNAVFLVAMLAASSSVAAEPVSSAGPVPGGFVGFNAMSPVAALTPVPLSTFASVLSNFDPGIGLSFGLDVGELFAGELRASFGSNSDTEQLLGAQLHGRFYALRAVGCGWRGLYLDAGARYWDLHNDLVDVHRKNVAASVGLGHRWDIERFFVDARANEILAMTTWSTAPHPVPGTGTVLDAWFQKTPLVSVDVGITFE
jgi:hypothetical protein